MPERGNLLARTEESKPEDISLEDKAVVYIMIENKSGLSRQQRCKFWSRSSLVFEVVRVSKIPEPRGPCCSDWPKRTTRRYLEKIHNKRQEQDQNNNPFRAPSREHKDGLNDGPAHSTHSLFPPRDLRQTLSPSLPSRTSSTYLLSLTIHPRKRPITNAVPRSTCQQWLSFSHGRQCGRTHR